jgi:4-diphosphocytidyl-2-C-methyl-D-erythritol kinase
MSKVKIKSYAKVNLTLEIVGNTGDYHALDSLVASVDIFDLIEIKSRRSLKNTVTMYGMNSEFIPLEQNHAKKAADAFCKKFQTTGVDITVYKNIPIGAGLGGSSADIVGVINGMAKLYGITDKKALKELADELGSDTGYMLTGGFAVMRGRGHIVENISVNEKLYIVVITDSATLSARQVYKKYDKEGKKYPFSTEKATVELVSGNLKKFCSLIKNDLYPSALSEVPIIGENICALEKEGALRALMTGSGTATFGIFADKKSRDKALKNLKATYGERVFGVETV